MEKIERPVELEEVGVLMHLVEYLLTQVVEALGCITIAPELATPSPIFERCHSAYHLAKRALDALHGKEEEE